MQRRTFIKDTAFAAMAVSAAGFIRFNGTGYEGDCETTTDILGPFYRPDAPVRSDMRIKNAVGQLMVFEKVNSGVNAINMKSYSSGVYFFRIIEERKAPVVFPVIKK